MPRALPHPEDRLLDSRQCAERIGCSDPAWWGIAKASPILRAGLRRRGRSTFWLASAVAAYCHDLPTTYTPSARRSA